MLKRINGCGAIIRLSVSNPLTKLAAITTLSLNPAVRLASLATALILLSLLMSALSAGHPAPVAAAPAPAAASTGEPTRVPAPTPAAPSWAVELPLTTTTVSLFEGNQCAVWGETVGSSPAVTVTAGPVLMSYSMFSHYTQTPRYEYSYLFTMRVGGTLADLSVNGEPLKTTYRGELRIEYTPMPVSKRYSYATYGLAQVVPGAYDLSGAWRLASGERDGPRRCRLVVTP